MAQIRTSSRRITHASDGAVDPFFAECAAAIDGQKKRIPLDRLEFFPGNWDITGRLKPEQRERVREDIRENGLREDLQVWPIEEHLYVVSGNERLEIIRSLSEKERIRQRLEDIPCVIKHFQEWPAARYHVQTVNQDRKAVDANPVKKLLQTWPIMEFPLLYADLRVKGVIRDLILPAGKMELDSPRESDTLREEQKRIRQSVASITGWSDGFITKTISKARSASSNGARQDPGELSREVRRKLENAKATVGRLLPKLQRHEEQIKRLQTEAAIWKRDIGKARKLLKKYSLEE